MQQLPAAKDSHEPKRRFRSLAYDSPDDVIFGVAPNPVSAGFGLTIGEGAVLPEVDFTLPTMSIEPSTWNEVQHQYQEMSKGVLAKATQLGCSALALEFEHLYELTTHPEWGAEITRQMKSIIEEAHKRHGLRSALRVTVADVREAERPPRMRTGEGFKKILESMEKCATSGADILSIESTGGKELFDKAIMRGDVTAILYSLGVLACSDMRYLWRRVTDITTRHNILAGGDSACAFANTAMQLAHQNYVPRVLAAFVRAVSAVRTLCAFEEGAVGPGKDCGYENPVIKIITGVPIAMEGKSAACAHSSPLGNIASAVCDLWTNESVQNVRLLGGQAPEVCTEMLIYDCRLMNTAHVLRQSKILRKLLIESDHYRDPQALFLDPDICFPLAKAIVSESDDYARTLKAASFACSTMRDVTNKNLLSTSAAESKWLDRIEKALASMPKTPEELEPEIKKNWGQTFVPEEYGLNT
ncbi:MAG: methyltransferase MtaB domain-containing protein [Candidatus Bathyarchaeia archaeon]